MFRRKPALEPCLPRPAKEPPAGPDWIHEIKHDGFRILARRDEDRVRLVTRNGYDFSVRYPKIVAAVEDLPIDSCSPGAVDYSNARQTLSRSAGWLRWLHRG